MNIDRSKTVAAYTILMNTAEVLTESEAQTLLGRLTVLLEKRQYQESEAALGAALISARKLLPEHRERLQQELRTL